MQGGFEALQAVAYFVLFSQYLYRESVWLSPR